MTSVWPLRLTPQVLNWGSFAAPVHRPPVLNAAANTPSAAPALSAVASHSMDRSTGPVATAGHSAAAATAAGVAATSPRQQRPSALARKLSHGCKGRPPAAQAMQWRNPAVLQRLHQLKQLWRDGELTLPVCTCSCARWGTVSQLGGAQPAFSSPLLQAVAAILRQEYGVARIGHGSVCRQFKM